tara:strand:+ start:90 stop:473 length:384 start_codon:yes stop_codon:yes gene_type:complete
MSLFISPKEFASTIVDQYHNNKDQYKEFYSQAPETFILVDFKSSQARVLFCEKTTDSGQTTGNKRIEFLIKAPAQSANTKVLCVTVLKGNASSEVHTIYRKIEKESRDAFANEVLGFLVSEPSDENQ